MGTDASKPTAMRYSNVIDLPQTAEDPNLLGGIVARHAEALAELIERAQMPFTIGIQGEWGSGKTSLMNRIEERLCRADKPDAELFYGVRINTWEYALMSSREEILNKVLSSIIKGTAEIAEKYPDADGVKLLNETKDYLRRALLGTAKFAGQIVTISKSGEGGKDAFDEWFEAIGFEVKTFRQKVQNAVNACVGGDCSSGETGKKRRGIIFFVDDLDRLDPPVAVQVLELLKNLFEVEHCIFILAIDYGVVVKGLRDKFGEHTEQNDREFRSFFDKIIQLPFTMPVPSYQIADFLANTLENIGYYDGDDSKNGLESPLAGAAEKKLKEIRGATGGAVQKFLVKNLLEQMARLSTGQNPRAVKRLINSLSLINIMHKRTLTPTQRQICFGMVCMQVAYTGIYNMLIEEPDFTQWGMDENKAHNLRWLPQGETLAGVPPKEKWKKIVYYASQGNSWLRERAMNIVNLLELMAACVPHGKILEKEFRKVINFTAVTSAGSAKSAVQDDISMSQEDLLEHLEYHSSMPQESRALLARILKNMETMLVSEKGEELVDVEYTQTEIKVTVLHYENSNALLRILLNAQTPRYAVPPVDGPFGSTPLTSEAETDGSFCKKLLDGYNMLAQKVWKLPESSLARVG
ncbi:MAG: hypothetical protein IJR28_05750 [Ottowia sp.]|nr:hypothetical protein [Ottowia sp.]